MKDHLCTLLITFNDFNDPVKEITTAHNFSNTDPNFYPQHRRVVHSTQKGSEVSFDSNAIIERISHSIRSSDSSILGSDLIENRIVNEKSEEFINNHLEKAFELSNQTSNNNNNDFGINPSPNNQLNVQEVTLTYMRENDAPILGPKPKSGAANKTLNKLSYSNAGSVQLNYCKNLSNLAPTKNVAQVQPYKIYENGDVQFNNGKYFEISDQLQTQQNFQLANKLNNNQKPKNYLTSPLQIKTTNLSQKQTYNQQHNNKRFQNDNNYFGNKKFINNYTDSQRTTPNFNIDKKFYDTALSTMDINLTTRSSNTSPKLSQQKRQENSYKSFEEYCSENRVACGHRTIFERKTSEIKMSKNTTKTFSYNKNTTTTAPIKYQNDSLSTECLIEHVKRKSNPTTINEIEQTNYINEINLTNIPQYHKNDIRLYTRYDDNFIFDKKNFEGNKRQKILQEKIVTDFSAAEEALTPTVSKTKPTSFNNDNNNYWVNVSHQSTSHFSLSPKLSNNNNNNNDDTFMTQYFPHTITPPHSTQWRDETEEEEEAFCSTFKEYNHKLNEKKLYNNVVKHTPILFESTKNFVDANIAQKPQQQSLKNDFYSLLDSEKELLANNLSLLKTSQELRLIDYDTYRREVDQLQRESIDYQSIKIEEPVPLTPAIIFNNYKSDYYNPQENIHQLKYFTKTDLIVNESSSHSSTQFPQVQNKTNIFIDYDSLNRSKSETNFLKNDYQSDSNIKNAVSTNSVSLTKNKTTNLDSSKAIDNSLNNNYEKSKIINQIFPYQKVFTSDEFSTNLNQKLNEITTTTTSTTTTTTFPAIDLTINSKQSNESFNKQQQKYIRNFKEREHEDFLESFCKNHQPFSSSQNQSLIKKTEEYEYRRFQESLDAETKRHPIYLEKTTKKNFDITINEVSPSRSTYKNVPIETYSTTTTSTSTPALTTTATASTPASTATTTNNNIVTTKFETNSTYQINKNFDETKPLEIASNNLNFKRNDSEQKNEQSMKAESCLINELKFNRALKDYTTPQKTSVEIGIQESATTIDEETDSHLFSEQNEASTQKDIDDIVENTTTVTGKELLETLRRELQYEELIDLEKRKCQSFFYDTDLMRDNLILERVEEEDNISETTERMETPIYNIVKNSRLHEQDFVDTSEPQILNECKDVTSENNKLEQNKPKDSVFSKQKGFKMPESKNTLTLEENILDTEIIQENSIIKTVIKKARDNEMLLAKNDDQIEHKNSGVRRESESPDSNSNKQNENNFMKNRFESIEFEASRPNKLSSMLNFDEKQNLFYENLKDSLNSNYSRDYRPTSQNNDFSVYNRDITAALSPPEDNNQSMEYQTSDYRSSISTRQNFVRPNRSVSPTPLNHRVLKMVSETSSLSSGLFSPYSGSVAASTIRDSREREKKDLSDLNDRLASYIEKVRFLEAQNRKLAADLDFLCNRWGKDTSNICKMYESEINQAKKLITETNSTRDDLESKIDKLYNEINLIRSKYEDAGKAHYNDKEKIDELLFKLSAIEAEISLIKRRISFFEEDVNAIKRENLKLLNDLQRTRNDLDQETLNRIDAKNQVQTLVEEIDFLCRSHDSEIFDLQTMVSRDTTIENREYFRNELLSAIRDIRNEYDQVRNNQRTDMESWYKLKVQEIQTQFSRQNMEKTYSKEEIRRLRVQMTDLRGKLADLEGRNMLLEKQVEDLNYQLEDEQETYESALNERDSQIRKLRDECQMLMVELQMLLDTKQSLSIEIINYRKMLEGEDDRVGLHQLVDQITSAHQFKHSDESETNRFLKTETSSRASYKRFAKGNVAIKEIGPYNNYIIIENTSHSKEENIGEWKLRRRIDNGKKDFYFTFPENYILKPLQSVKVWARNSGSTLSAYELEFDGEESFGTGNHVQTILYNSQGEERASVVQRLNYAPTY